MQRDSSNFHLNLEHVWHFPRQIVIKTVEITVCSSTIGYKVLIIDAPFTGTKSQLAGFHMLEARDMNEAED